jgi:hypothetical protein
MAKVVALKAQPPQPADERAALRSAIAAVDEARRALERHRAAIGLAKQRIAQATGRAETARAATNQARRKVAENLANELTGAEPRPKTGRKALIFVAREKHAANEVDTARAALDHLTKTLPDAENAVAVAENGVLVEINALMAPLVRRFLAEGEEARRTFISMRVALRALARDFEPLPKFAQDAGSSFRASAARAEPLGGLRDEAENFGRFGLYHSRDEEAETEFQVAKLWHQAREALRTDPDAVLPEIR